MALRSPAGIPPEPAGSAVRVARPSDTGGVIRTAQQVTGPVELIAVIGTIPQGT